MEKHKTWKVLSWYVLLLSSACSTNAGIFDFIHHKTPDHLVNKNKAKKGSPRHSKKFAYTRFVENAENHTGYLNEKDLLSLFKTTYAEIIGSQPNLENVEQIKKLFPHNPFVQRLYNTVKQNGNKELVVNK